MSEPRDFPTMLNEWTDTLLEINKRATGAEALSVVARIGPLGQRLIYEAYNLGMDKVMRMIAEEKDKCEPTTMNVSSSVN